MALPLAAIALAAPASHWHSFKDWLLDKHSSYLDLLLVTLLVALGLALSMRWRTRSQESPDPEHPPGS